MSSNDVFSAPEFSNATSALLTQAALLCDRRGARLTDLRRMILGLVLESGRPIGAYVLLERLRSHHKGSAPPTVYRALDFLCEQGLIHKIESLAAFLGCVHATEEEDHAHAARFLICTTCGQAAEIDDRRIDKALLQAADDSGFHVRSSTVEIEGTCAICVADPGSAKPTSTDPNLRRG
ncbi:MAG: Fur family transcriptional regulator [Janthinobacterium lividum]